MTPPGNDAAATRVRRSVAPRFVSLDSVAGSPHERDFSYPDGEIGAP